MLIKSKPLVSVFMPVYNAEDFIVEAVEAIINQSYGNIELVISDDCSTDNSSNILINLQRKYPEVIKLFLQDINLGITENCNFLLQKCKGEFICFTAGDDVLNFNCIEVGLNRIINNNEIAIVFHDNIKVDSKSNEIFRKAKNINEHVGNAKLFFKKGIYVQVNGMLVRKSCIPWEGYDSSLRLGSDFDFVIKILGNNNKFLYLNNKLSKYRIHSNSITKTRELECKLDVLNGMLSLLTRYPENSYDLLSLVAVRFRSIRKFNFETMIKASLGIRPWNIKTLFIYIVYMVTLKNIKL